MKKRSGCRTFLILIALIVICGIIAAVAALAWYSNQIYSPVDADGEYQTFTIESGQSTSSIGEQLANVGLISSKDAFYIYLRLQDPEADLKAGEFKLSPAMSMVEIIEELKKSPERQTAWITIREGQRYSEIVDSLESQLADQGTNLDYGLLESIMDSPDNYMDQFSPSVQTFLAEYKPDGKSLEGFIYPDTYNLDTRVIEVTLIDMLIQTLINKLEAEDLLTAITASDFSLYETLTMASIAERETNTSQDYPIVTGILFNRLDIGEPLGADVTLLYSVGDWKHELRQSELDDLSNPYNTRRLTGFPPTPISNPGIETIKAAIYPEDTDYLFYITGLDGNMYYARTLSEHNQNIRDYL